MTLFRVSTVGCVALAALLLAACGDVIDPSDNITEEFAGTLNPGSGNLHPFSTSNNGEFEVRITRLGNPDAFLGVTYGPEISGTCTTQQTNIFGQLNRVAAGGFINKGRHCVSVFDATGLSQPLTYTITISHPR